MDPDVPWREVQDIPSFQLMNIMRNPPQLPTENNSPFSLQNATLPLNITDNHDRDGLQMTESLIDFNPIKMLHLALTDMPLK